MVGILRAIAALMFNHTSPRSSRSHGEDDEDRTVEQSKCTILAIDDDPAVLQVFRELLLGQGFNVLTATSSAKGLDMVRYAQRDIRVVVLDFNMPQLDGSETLLYLRKLSPHVKVLGVTGVDVRLLSPSFRDGVDKFIHKPFRNEELVAALHSLLGNGATPL
jgi:CheY-like chemotaxis protein